MRALGPVQRSILGEIVEFGFLALPFPEEERSLKALVRRGILVADGEDRWKVDRGKVPKSFWGV